MLTFAAGCHSAPPGSGTPGVVPVGPGAATQDSLELLHAVAIRVAAQNRGAAVSVYPVFSRLTGEAIVGTAARDSIRQRRVSQAFAEALGAQIADVSRHAALNGRAGQSTATVGIVALLLQPDSAYVDLTFLPSVSDMHGQWMFTAYRYRFRRDQGRWSFVRREWLGSA